MAIFIHATILLGVTLIGLVPIDRSTSDIPVWSQTSLPTNIAALPYIVRRALPVIVTLDGAVFYPQLIGVKSACAPMDTVLSAQFLGR